VFATVVGAAYLAKGAAAATRRLETGELGDYDESFLAARVTIARFFARQLLPGALGLLPAVTAGADDLYALDVAELGP
jgi:hypothetical protein